MAAGPLGMSIGMSSGETRLGPFSSMTSCWSDQAGNAADAGADHDRDPFGSRPISSDGQ